MYVIIFLVNVYSKLYVKFFKLILYILGSGFNRRKFLVILYW